MKIIIEIPKEFEIDYNKDKFEDFFGRVKTDIDEIIEEFHLTNRCDCIFMSGNYERETALMFMKAFKEGKELK